MISSLRTSDERFLNTLSQINNRLAKAQQQSASGKRLLDVSDDPDQVTAVDAAEMRLDGAAVSTYVGHRGRRRVGIVRHAFRGSISHSISPPCTVASLPSSRRTRKAPTSSMPAVRPGRPATQDRLASRTRSRGNASGMRRPPAGFSYDPRRQGTTADP